MSKCINAYCNGHCPSCVCSPSTELYDDDGLLDDDGNALGEDVCLSEARCRAEGLRIVSEADLGIALSFEC